METLGRARVSFASGVRLFGRLFGFDGFVLLFMALGTEVVSEAGIADILMAVRADGEARRAKDLLTHLAAERQSAQTLHRQPAQLTEHSSQSTTSPADAGVLVIGGGRLAAVAAGPSIPNFQPHVRTWLL